MATGTTFKSALEKLGDHLDCSICQERFAKPKLLDCVHSFCEDCLEKYCMGETKISCPLCRQETVLPEKGVRGLKSNFHLIGLVDEMSLQEKVAWSPGQAKPTCEICVEGNEATQRCLDCAQNICPNCSKTHRRIAATSNHTMATFQDIRQGKVTVKKTQEDDGCRCQNHKGEVKRFYCETCEELICRDCIVVKHCKPQHRYIEASEAYLKYKQSMKDTLLAPLNVETNRLKQSLTVTSQSKQKLRNNVNRTVNEVQNRAAQKIAQIKAEENRLIDAIKNVEQDRNQTFDEQEKTLSVMLQRKQHSLETARDITDTASEGDFLSLYPVIGRDLTLMLSTPDPTTIGPELSSLNFRQSPAVGDIILGELDLAGEWELHLEFRRESAPGISNWARAVDAARPGEIVLADSLNRRLVIFTSEGRHKNTIRMGTYPLDVAAVHKRLVVVDDSTCVKMYKTDNKLDFQFPTVPPSEVGVTDVNLQSVTVKKDGTIIVGDVKRKVLTEHSPVDGSLLRTFAVQTEPYYLAVDDNGRIVISGGSNKVVVADCDGVTLFTFNPSTDGKAFKYNRGACCNMAGFFIAMRQEGFNTGHIHHYSWDGRFLRCVAQGLYNPRGIAATGQGQLVVADAESVKIYNSV